MNGRTPLIPFLEKLLYRLWLYKPGTKKMSSDIEEIIKKTHGSDQKFHEEDLEDSPYLALQLLKPEKLRILLPSQLKGLTADQLKELTAEQLKGLTAEQKMSIVKNMDKTELKQYLNKLSLKEREELLK